MTFQIAMSARRGLPCNDAGTVEQFRQAKPAPRCAGDRAPLALVPS